MLLMSHDSLELWQADGVSVMAFLLPLMQGELLWTEAILFVCKQG